MTRTLVFCSSGFSCAASRAPFWSFCFSSCGLSFSFSSSSPLYRTRSRTGHVSFSSSWSPHHSMKQTLGVGEKGGGG